MAESMFASREAAQEWRRGMSARNEAMAPATQLMLESAHIGPGSRVLDLGVGTGDTALLVAERVGVDGHVLATDVSQPMLDLAAEAFRDAGYDHVMTRVMDAASIDVAPASFDAVVGRHSLQFVPDIAAALAGIHAALRPGGRLAAVVWGRRQANRYSWLPVAIAKDLGLMRADEAVVMRPYFLGDDNAGLIAKLEDAGLADAAVTPIAGERRAPSLQKALEWSTHGPLFRTIAAQLTDTERTTFEAALADATRGFADGDEVVGPMELLVVSATR